MFINVYGLMSSLRVNAWMHNIVETKKDREVDGLRLYNQWPELIELLLEEDFTKLDKSHDFMHIPFACILYQVMERWKKTHENNPPKTYEEKEEFRSLIEIMRKEPIPMQQDLIWKLNHENDAGTIEEQEKHMDDTNIRLA